MQIIIVSQHPVKVPSLTFRWRLNTSVPSNYPTQGRGREKSSHNNLTTQSVHLHIYCVSGQCAGVSRGSCSSTEGCLEGSGVAVRVVWRVVV